jgi:hypothetical protein
LRDETRIRACSRTGGTAGSTEEGMRTAGTAARHAGGAVAHRRRAVPAGSRAGRVAALARRIDRCRHLDRLDGGEDQHARTRGTQREWHHDAGGGDHARIRDAGDDGGRGAAGVGAGVERVAENDLAIGHHGADLDEAGSETGRGGIGRDLDIERCIGG